MDLSPRERAVLLALARGASQKEVATAHGVSPVTVHRQVASIYDKTGCDGLIAVLLRFGWLTVPDA